MISASILTHSYRDSQSALMRRIHKDLNAKVIRCRPNFGTANLEVHIYQYSLHGANR